MNAADFVKSPPLFFVPERSFRRQSAHALQIAGPPAAALPFSP